MEINSLDDVMAVQTLSRLNRIFPGKDMTFVLDFRNDAEDILAAFEPYYRTAQLAGITDRNMPHQLRDKLDHADVYLWSEVEAFAKLYFSQRNDQAFQAHLKQAFERYEELGREEQELFRRDAASYVTSYDFLSQLVDYDDPELEKLHAFLKMLLPRLRGQEPDPVLIDGAVRLAGYKLVNKREHDIKLEKGEAKPLNPLSAGGGEAWEDPRQKLSEIIKKIHSLFTGKYTDAEVAGWFTAVTGNVVADQRIQMQAKANPTADQFANGDYKLVLGEAIAKALASHHAMSEQTLQNPKVFEDVAEALLHDVYEKARAGAIT